MWKVHHDGADACDELAIAISEAAELHLDTIISKRLRITFSFDLQLIRIFSWKLLKFERFRILWQAFATSI